MPRVLLRQSDSISSRRITNDANSSGSSDVNTNASNNSTRSTVKIPSEDIPMTKKDERNSNENDPYDFDDCEFEYNTDSTSIVWTESTQSHYEKQQDSNGSSNIFFSDDDDDDDDEKEEDAKKLDHPPDVSSFNTATATAVANAVATATAMTPIRNPSRTSPPVSILKGGHSKSNVYHTATTDQHPEDIGTVSLSTDPTPPSHPILKYVQFQSNVQFQTKNSSSSSSLKRKKSAGISSRSPRKMTLSSSSSFSPKLHRRRLDMTVDGNDADTDASILYTATPKRMSFVQPSLKNAPLSIQNCVHVSPNDYDGEEIHSSSTTTPAKIATTKTLTCRGIGIDTRFLSTFVGDAISQRFRHLILEFLESCQSSGLLSHSIISIVSSGGGSYSGSSTKKKNMDMTCIAKPWNKDHRFTMIPIPMPVSMMPIPMQEPSSHPNPPTRTLLPCPKPFTAASSWNLLGDLVESMVLESRSKTPCPMDITLFTHDTALFVDIRADAHKTATQRFWNRIRSHFSSNIIQSVHIICFHTGVNVLSTEENSATSDVPSSSNLPIDSEEEGISYRIQITKCVQAIQNQLANLARKESSVPKNTYLTTALSTSAISSYALSSAPMDITLSVQDFQSIQFEKLLKSWTCQDFSILCPKGIISFDLPETMDGTICTLTLELSYRILPYQVNSIESELLAEEMKKISKSSFSVLQLAPLDEIDLSLIHGVPMVAKAGLQGDIEQYKEMQKITNVLLRYLSCSDSALVLQCESISPDAISDSSIYLLMAKETNEKSDASKASFRNATMHRYCRKASEILEEDVISNEESVITNANDVEAYSDVVKNALESLSNEMIHL